MRPVPGRLRFGRLTEDYGDGRTATQIGAETELAITRDDAALVVADALPRRHLAHQAVHVVEGELKVDFALDAIWPRPLPPPGPPSTRRAVPIAVAQSDNPPDDPDMIAPDAPPLDADVEWEGDGPVRVEPTGNDDPAPRIP